MNSKLIYDIGSYKGEDTAFYLHFGYTVIAIDASIENCNFIASNFHKEVEAGRLKIINAYISNEDGKKPFHTSKLFPFLNGSDLEHIKYISQATIKDNPQIYKDKVDEFNTIFIDTVDFQSIYKQNEIPYYMKLDIEGCEEFCFQAITNDNKPKYISTECHPDKKYYIDILFDKGYRKFQILNQEENENFIIPNWKFEFHSSGPFGHFLEEGSWVDKFEIQKHLDFLHSQNKFWLDIHATY